MIAKRHTLANALRVAAEQYACDALAMKAEPNDLDQRMPTATRRRIAEQFERQAIEAIDLALAIEQADTIDLED